MRQGDGSDLLGQSDPRNADIGILYIGPEDSRQEILTAINAQELQGRKQIAIVLPEQGKAFRQPVEFDGLKNMRRGLKAQLIFIAPPGPGPAEFARHRRFVVYSSLETFRTALINEGALYNPRGKAVHGSERRSGTLGKGRMSKDRDRNAPPPLVVPAAQLPPAMPPTPRIVPAASAQPVMPPTPPTPYGVPQATGPDRPVGSPISPMPQIEDMDTHTFEFENPAQGQGSGPALVAGAGLGALAASALDDDDDLAPVPPMTPRQPSGGAPSGGLSGKTPDARRSPTPLLLGQQTNTPRPGGSGKLPAASARGSQTRTGGGKQPPVQGRSTKQLSPTQGTSDAPKPPNGQGSSGKLPAALPIGAAAMAVGAASSGDARSAAANAPIPAAMAVTGTPGGPGPRQGGLTPLPAPVSQRKRRVSRRRRFVLFLLLGLLTLAVVGGILVSALGGPAGLATFGRLTATVNITPQSQNIQNKYVISGVTTTPNAAQHQVSARVLPTQSGTQQGTHGATGSISATQATGPLLFFNGTGTGLTIAGSKTVLTAANGVQVTFSGTVFVPATGNGEATVNNAYVIQSGAAGNIPALSIAEPCCVAGITVKNPSAFHGGQDAQPNSIIQQSDIEGAINSVAGPLKTNAQAALQKQVKSNERVADGSLQCKPTTQPNHKAGDQAASVSVSVTVACTEEVFDFTAAQQMASNLLITDQPSGINLEGYKLVGAIIPSLESTTVSSADNQVTIIMQAAGRWVYQFSSQQQQLIKQKLVTHSKADALNILKGYVGLASASINISTGSMMPATASDITISLVAIPGFSPGTPIVTATSYVPVGGTPTVGTPSGKGTPSGGS
jgi:hypothetical protein